MESQFFPNAMLLKAGYEPIDDEIKKMRDELLKAEGVVDAGSQSDFRLFLKSTMKRKMLDQIGGDVSLFDTSSFRQKSKMTEAGKRLSFEERILLLDKDIKA